VGPTPHINQWERDLCPVHFCISQKTQTPHAVPTEVKHNNTPVKTRHGATLNYLGGYGIIVPVSTSDLPHINTFCLNLHMQSTRESRPEFLPKLPSQQDAANYLSSAGRWTDDGEGDCEWWRNGWRKLDQIIQTKSSRFSNGRGGNWKGTISPFTANGQV
jgi:hypothetical protein